MLFQCCAEQDIIRPTFRDSSTSPSKLVTEYLRIHSSENYIFGCFSVRDMVEYVGFVISRDDDQDW